MEETSHTNKYYDLIFEHCFVMIDQIGNNKVKES